MRARARTLTYTPVGIHPRTHSLLVHASHVHNLYACSLQVATYWPNEGATAVWGVDAKSGRLMQSHCAAHISLIRQKQPQLRGVHSVCMYVCIKVTYMYACSFLPMSNSCHCAFCNSASKDKKRPFCFISNKHLLKIVACPAVCTARLHPATKVRGPLVSFAVVQLFATPGECWNGLFSLQWPCNSGDVSSQLSVCAPHPLVPIHVVPAALLPHHRDSGPQHFQSILSMCILIHFWITVIALLRSRLDIWPENPHKVSEVGAGKNANESWAALTEMTRCKESVSSCRARDGQMRLWNLALLMDVDWILPPFSFTHTQTELQCYSERVSCLNPRTESEKERKAERGRKRRRREQEE